jgi:hypothetical protein
VIFADTLDIERLTLYAIPNTTAVPCDPVPIHTSTCIVASLIEAWEYPE